jgi:putative peptidoglycan lipid II flippase
MADDTEVTEPSGIDPGPVEFQAGEEPGLEALDAARESTTAMRGRLARSTALFSLATSASRIAGLVREVFAASYFGVTPQMSAFTIAFYVPNLVRSLFADAAIQAAFVPVFTEKLQRGQRQEAFRLASTLIFLVGIVLTALTALFIVLAPVIMPLFVPGGNVPQGLTTSLAQLLFPILVMLGVTGMVVGVLNSYDRFGAYAISPFFWNVAIILTLILIEPAFSHGNRIYAYAIGVLVGTAIQLAIPTWDLRHTPFRLRPVFDWRSPDVRHVMKLMLPVTLSLGLINFDLLINAIFGSLVSPDAPAAIDKAFRIYMLPQGIFSVAVTTVLFPTLARFAANRDYDGLRSTMANGMRQIWLLLIPASAAILALSHPMIELVYQRGEFDSAATNVVSTALFWFAFSLPFNGVYLLLTRTFFSLQRPWVPTAISGFNLVIDAIASAALYGPFGVGGLVAATAIATVAGVVAESLILRRQLGRLELGRFARSGTGVIAAAAALAGSSWLVWDVLHKALGTGLGAQIISLSGGLAVGAVVYWIAINALRIPEAQQIRALVRGRRGA